MIKKVFYLLVILIQNYENQIQQSEKQYQQQF